ncbi:MAG: hypothetical protein WBX01_02195 [Nitrososphaeraceae archaeon]|jgi:hypothetical protein
MNEQDLQKLFIESLLSGKIQGIDDIIDISSLQKAERIVRIKKEAYFRYFDLVIGIISLQRNLPTMIKIESIDKYDRYHNLTMRTSELLAFAREENCRVDLVDLIPVEIKSDNDSLDERLPRQVINAILAFGRSVVVFDKNHTARIQKYDLFRLLPASIIGYMDDGRFKVISSDKRIVGDSLVRPQKSAFAKILSDNGLFENLTAIYSHLDMTQRIYQKVLFNQIFEEKIDLLQEEIEFLSRLNKNPNFHEKEQIKKIVRESINRKITDYA